MKTFLARIRRPRTIIILVIIALLLWGAYSLWFAPQAQNYQLATATRGTIIQQVSVTGNTTPVTSLDLAFEYGGTIATVNFDVRDHVNAGSPIVLLDTRDLQAQLAQAKANVDSQTAKLHSLQAGSRPEDIQASQAALAKAQQDLANMYANISNMLSDGYAKANDAVRNQLAAFFSNAEMSNPHLTFSVSDSQILNDVQSERVQASAELNAWQSELASITAFSPTAAQDTALQKGIAHLVIIKTMLTDVSQAVVKQTGLSESTVNTYTTAVTAALSEVNTATTNANAAAQDIASQKIAIDQLRAQLNLKLAGSTKEDIDAQQAVVEQALASAASIQVKIAKASLVSPIAGVVTVQNAKVGQIAAPNIVMVSLISDQGLEVDADIPEADIGKVHVNDPATMTLDAFPGKTFSGKISYIDPGETVIEGVPTYKTTFQFDNLGPEVKPGMTANIDIMANRHDNAIYIPQQAVTTALDGSRTVQVYHGAKQPLETRTVTVGLRDTEGNIEIISGLTEGEVVVRSTQ